MKNIILIIVVLTSVNLTFSQSENQINQFELHNLIQGMEFADSLNGVVFTTLNPPHAFDIKRSIYITKDGGYTWDEVYSFKFDSVNMKMPKEFYQISYPKAGYIIAAVDSGYLLRSTDYGESWTEIDLDGERGNSISAKLKINKDGTGVCNFMDYPYDELTQQNYLIDYIHYTSDYGESWELAYIGNKDSYLFQTADIYDNKIYATFNKDMFGYYDLITEEFVTLFEYKIFEKYDNLNFKEVEVLDNGNIILLATNSKNLFSPNRELVFYSGNRGQSFEIKHDTLHTNHNVSGLNFYDNDIGSFIGYFYSLYTTFNGGETWEEYTWDEFPEGLGLGISQFISEDVLLLTTVNAKGDVLYRIDFRTSNVETISLTKNNIIYPNPATSVITISNLEPGTEYKIYNTLGLEVASGIYNKNIDVANLLSGVYFIQIPSTGETLKFAKE